MGEQYILRYLLESKYFRSKRVVYDYFNNFSELMEFVRENDIKEYTIYSKVIL